MAYRQSLTPTERSLRARAAVHQSWANTPDRAARTQPGRDRLLSRFEDQVDPERKLPTAERARRAEAALRSYFSGLSLKASQARRGAANGKS